MALTLALGIAAQALTIDNGQDCSNSYNVIDHWDWWEHEIEVRDGSGGPTEVCVVDGGAVGDLHRRLMARDTSTITMTGGRVGWELWAMESSTITVSGGQVDQRTWVFNSSTVTVSGGDLHQVIAADSSTVTVSGGTVRGLRARNNATLTLLGGTITDDLSAGNVALLKVVGSGFQVDGVPVPLGNLTATSGRLTGLLASGDSLNANFFQGGASPNDGTIRLVPEPSTALLLGAGLLGILGVIRRRAA